LSVFVWLAILYAGADHPPPRGFIFVVLLVFAVGVLVCLRVPNCLKWIEMRQANRLVWVVCDGLAARLAFALLALAATSLLGSGERLALR